jgi:DNA (cytosine-5)-methyltransferase 1
MSHNTAISLFSGLGGDTLGITLAGGNVIAYNELKPVFSKSHESNFPDSVLICEGKTQDISKLKDETFVTYAGKAQIIFAGFPCFIKDTLVLTDNGYKEIQNVAIEDKLLTHTGKFQKLVNLQRKEYNGLLYEIKLKYHPDIITCTEEHPFYVREQKKTWNSSLKKYDYSYGEPMWKTASKLTMNDYFGMVINTEEKMTEFEQYMPEDGIKEWVVDSLNLAYDIQRLYLKLGHIVSIEKVFCDVNQCNAYKICVYSEPPNDTTVFIEGNYVWYAPVEITKRETQNEPVYNFEVENDNSYIVYNTIVHNCQGFSTAGKKKDDDPRNTMFLEFLRATKLISPNMIIGENVKGLLTKKASNGELYIDIIVSEFNKIGYDVIYKVFKCEEYNVPQKRERLIILGIKKDNPFGWKPSFPAPSTSKPHQRNIIQYSMTGAIKVDPNLFEKIPEECILTNMSDTTVYKDNNGAHPYLLSKLFADINGRSYNGKSYDCLFSFSKRDSPIHCEIIDIRKPSKTIICTYEHQPRLFVPIKNPSGCYLRMLLPDELKQIQGFPADYIVCGTDKEKIIQIGNAVPPPLIKAIVENVIGKQ